jgi:hypothetical protein
MLTSPRPSQAVLEGGDPVVPRTFTASAVPLRFYFGPFRVGVYALRLLVRETDGSLFRATPALPDVPDMEGLQRGEHGYLFRSQPLPERLPSYALLPRAIRYVPQQFHRYFIDMSLGYDGYLARFSSKTRSTLQRKMRKLGEVSGGKIDFREYRTPAEAAEFLALARTISVKTYQEKLYDAGLPDSTAFHAQAQRLAEQGDLRAYLILHDGRPISYLYCPADRGRLIYQYLGYDPEYAKLSPGTVLQLLALQCLFREPGHSVFDFTEGEGDHKRMFATGNVFCGNIYFLRRTGSLRALMAAHRSIDRSGNYAVDLVGRLGIRSALRRLLRS